MSTLVVATAARVDPSGRVAAAAVLRWPDGTARTTARRLRPADPVPPAWRALLLGLWAARRAGAPALVLTLEDAEVAAALAPGAEPPANAVVASLQARALLHAFASAEIRTATCADPTLAAAAAAAVAAVAAPGGA